MLTAFISTNTSALRASYLVANRIAKAKKPLLSVWQHMHRQSCCHDRTNFWLTALVYEVSLCTVSFTGKRWLAEK